MRLEPRVSEVFAALPFTDCAPTCDPGHDFVTLLNFSMARRVLTTPGRDYLIKTHNAPKKGYVRAL